MADEKRNEPDKQEKNPEYDPADAPVTETSLEELEELQHGYEQDLAEEYLVDTQHTEGSTHDPTKAQEQGLVYTPPTDPPVMPSDDLQGAEVAAGFAPSMEASDPDVEVLPESVDDNDLELANDIREALHVNSETTHLTDVHVRVRDGIVYLTGTVFSNDDLSLVDEVVRDLEGVVDVRNHLQTAA